MIITREVINKNIKFYDYDILSFKLFEYNFNYLSKCIDLYKNFLLSSGIQPQKTVLIGEDIGIWQVAALFACYELGLTVIIFDFFNNPDNNPYVQKKTFNLDVLYIDKIKNLLPIDYFILSYEKLPVEKEINSKHYYTKQYANKTLVRYFDHDDVNKSKICNTVISQKEFVLTKSLTSGTSGPPKCILHTHEFLYSLMYRNSKQFYGKYLNTRSLNHGSSIFCYLMPAIICKNVTDFYLIQNFPRINPTTFTTKKTSNETLTFEEKILKMIEFCNDVGGVDHIATCDASVCEAIFKQIKSNFFSRTNIHILSYIKSEWVDNYYKTGVIGDIVSNFGSNETTGPVFLNKASDKNFSETLYKKNDNYFDVKIVNDGLEVSMPVYNKTIIMKDKFVLEDDAYNHQGRIDLLRINDLQINSKQYSSISNEYFHSELVFDQIKSEIYLVIWEQINFSLELEEKVNTLNIRLLSISEGKHKITKYSILNYETYFGSIKLDMEKLREYFRTPDENYKKLN